jgi:biopolymer transport protein ExbD
VTGINVTPLVDVLLVLIVVGLVAFGLSRRTLPVTLPARTLTPGPVAPIVLELPASGGYRLNGQVIPDVQLSDQLASVFRSRPAKILFITTGAARSYQEFITAADVARGAGVVTIAVVGGGR